MWTQKKDLKPKTAYSFPLPRYEGPGLLWFLAGWWEPKTGTYKILEQFEHVTVELGTILTCYHWVWNHSKMLLLNLKPFQYVTLKFGTIPICYCWFETILICYCWFGTIPTCYCWIWNHSDMLLLSLEPFQLVTVKFGTIPPCYCWI